MKTINIIEKGDRSVGIEEQTVATLQIENDDYAAQMVEDGTLFEFETKLAALVEQYFGTEFHTYTEDNITPKPEWY